MNTTQKILVFVALGLSLIAVLSSSSVISLGGVSPSNINCNGRAYCTAFVDLLVRNASSTGSSGLDVAGTIRANTLTATGTVTMDRVLWGGGVADITGSGTSTTFTAAQICDNSVIRWTATEGQSTSTLPATTALTGDCLAEAGAMKQLLLLHNGVASSSITFAVGDASTTLNFVSTSTLSGQNSALMLFYRATSTAPSTIQVDVIPFQS